MHEFSIYRRRQQRRAMRERQEDKTNSSHVVQKRAQNMSSALERKLLQFTE